MDTIETPAAQSSARGKAKRIVLCTDGTCNAFGRHSSNVTKLIELLDLSDKCVCKWLHTIRGSAPSLVSSSPFRHYEAGLPVLHLLPLPNESWLKP